MAALRVQIMWNKKCDLTVFQENNFDFEAVPEPSSLALLLGAFGFFGLRRRR